MASETKENNVRVYTIANIHAGALSKLASSWGLEANCLGGYISVVLASHLAMYKRPCSSLELETFIKQLGFAANATLVDSCNRLIAMIRERRVEYYKSHRREFVPESLDEEIKASDVLSPGKTCGSPLGKFSDRLRLSNYLAAPLSEADITHALTHMMGFVGNNVVALRTVKAEPIFFSQPSSTGFRGAEEQRIAFIQQRSFFGSEVFVETAHVREPKEIDVFGCRGVIDRADGMASAYDAGCGLVTRCLTLNTYVAGLELCADNFRCYPFIIDVSDGSLPSCNGSETLPRNGFSSQRSRLGHHVLAFPVVLEGRRLLVVLDSEHRVATYKTEGHVYHQERLLADALNHTSDGRTLPANDTLICAKSFSHRRCKLCQVIHASDMHAEFQ